MKLNTFLQKQKRKWNRLISLPAMAVALMFGASCNNNDSTTIKSIQVSSLAPLGGTKVPVGVMLPLQAKAIFQDDHMEDVTSIVTWSSSSNLVATVSNEAGKQGSVLGKTKGTVKITATTMNDISGTLEPVEKPI